MNWEQGLVNSSAMLITCAQEHECEGPWSKNSSLLILRAQSAAARQ